MRRANVVSGVVLALFGLVMLFGVIPWQIEEGPAGMMSPRLVPTMMMVVVIGLSVLLVVGNRRPEAPSADADGAFPVSRAELLALAKIGGVFALALAMFFLVSPLVAGIALIAGTLLVLGERRPLVLLLMPAGLLATVWFVFYRLLGTAIL